MTKLKTPEEISRELICELFGYAVSEDLPKMYLKDIDRIAQLITERDAQVKEACVVVLKEKQLDFLARQLGYEARLIEVAIADVNALDISGGKDGER